MSEPTVLDRAHLDRLAELGGADLVHRMVDLFASSSDARLATMRDARTTGDWPALEAVAHSLRSSAATVGATALAARFEALETQAAAGDGEAATATALACESMLAEACQALVTASAEYTD